MELEVAHTHTHTHTGSHPEHAFHVGGNLLRGRDYNRETASTARKHLLTALHLLAILVELQTAAKTKDLCHGNSNASLVLLYCALMNMQESTWEHF